MKRTVCIALASIALILMNSLPGLAREGHGGHEGHEGGRGNGGFGISIGPVWDPWGWGAYYPPSYPSYPYYAEPPVVVPQQPDIYVQPTPEREAPVYWYYCQNPEGYYPYVKRCPMGWMKVVPSAPQGEEEK